MPKEKTQDRDRSSTISRRGFLKGMGTGAVAATVAPTTLVNNEKPIKAKIAAEITQAKIKLNLNSEAFEVEVEPRTTLLSVLRDGIDTNGRRVDLTGAKLICDRGECGGCSVLVSGKPVYSCMMLAIDAQDKQIVTVEGLANGSQLHPVQEAFIEHDALMCGFCTPGFVVVSKSLLDHTPNPTLEEVKEGLSGNICRCGTYPFIFEAVKTASCKRGT